MISARSLAVVVLLAAAAVAFAVRRSYAAAPFGRFTVAAVTASDTVTGLMWQRGFQPSQFGGTGANTANAYCETLSLAGFSDWRLPSAKELMTLWDEYEASSRIDNGIFSPAQAGSVFWSSSPYASGVTFGIAVSYATTGGPGPWQYNFGGNARCVRTVPTDGGT